MQALSVTRHLSGLSKSVLLLLFLIFSQRSFAQTPTITSFSPISGDIGATVTINGTNFNATAANNIVFFGATKASVVSASATSLTVTVPAGATHASITVLNTVTSLIAYSQTYFRPMSSPKGGFGSTDLDDQLTYPTGSTPRDVTMGDMDGDGKPDLVVANGGASTVSVFLNTGSTGNISFAAKQDFLIASGSLGVAVGDIDGDGLLDLAATNNATNSVSVLRNTSSVGTISFAVIQNFTTGVGPRTVLINDMDGDGKADLIVGPTFSVLRNNGGVGVISFEAKLDFAALTGNFITAVGDLDKNGLPDVVVAQASRVAVFRNMSTSGTLAFGLEQSFATVNTAQGVVMGDMNSDGLLDLAVVNRIPNSVSVLRNTSSSGSISFATKLDFSTGVLPIAIATGDMDGDGLLDLTVGRQNGGTIGVLRNESISGSISFGAVLTFSTGATGQQYVAVGDLDSDGLPDIAVVKSTGGNEVSVFRNRPIAPVITSFAPLNATAGTSVTITGDHFNTVAANNTVYFGATKAVVTASSATAITATVPVGATHAPVTVLNANTDLSAAARTNFVPVFSPPKGTIKADDFAGNVSYPSGVDPTWSAAGDLDGDGKTDIAVTYGDKVAVFLNTGSTGTIGMAAAVEFTANSTTRSVSIGDIDGDGKPDMAVTNYFSSNVSIFRNTSTPGNLSFVKTDFAAGANPFHVIIADINNDGKPDLTVTNETANTISVLRNTGIAGVISFAALTTYATGLNPRIASVADLDGDGKADIAVTNMNSNTVSVLLNTTVAGATSLTFAAKTDFTVGNAPWAVSTGDLDGDGKLDMAVANSTSNNMSVMLNTSTAGNISFGPKTDFPSVNAPAGIAIGDIDGDGKPDVAVSGYNGGVSAFHNESTAGTINFAGSVSFAPGSQAVNVVIADLDGDGRPDLEVPNRNVNTLSILRYAPPLISQTGVLVAVNSTYGSASGISSFTVSGTEIVSGIMITPPSGFELSQTAGGASGYAGNGTAITVTGTGTIASTTIYVRLAASTPVGTYSGNIVSASGFASMNTVTVLSTVSPAALTITPANVVRTYHGPVLTGAAGSTTFTATGLQNSETIGSVTIGYTAGAGNGNVATDGAGTYTGTVIATAATGGTFSAANYTISYATGNLTVNTVPLTITANNAARTYGSVLTGAAGSTAFTSSGLLNSETIGSVTLSYAGSGNNATDAAGTYNGAVIASAATGGTFSATNYAITYVPGNLRVNTAPLTITANTAARTYGSVLTGAAGSTAFTSSGLLNSETIGSVTLSYVGSGNNAVDAAGTYSGAIAASAATGGTFSATNYAISYLPGNLTVHAAPLTITAANKTRIYGTANPAFTASFTGFVNGDTETNLTTKPAFNTTATINSPAGTYPVTPLAASSPNYSITYIDGVLTVLPVTNIAPAFTVIANQLVCYTSATQSVTISGISAGGEIGQTVTLAVSSNVNLFSSISVSPVINGTANINYVLRPGVSGTAQITVKATDDGGTLNGGTDTFSRIFTISVNALPVAAISNDITISKGSTTTLTASGGTTYQWSNAGGIVGGQNTAVLTVRPLVTTSYTVAVTNSSECTVQQTVTVTVEDDYKALDPLNAITPNGDGKNDTWVIGNIDAYPNNTVRVYDRAGRPVYSKRGYNNEWDGTFNGLPLQQDTYYFIVDFGTGVKPLKGFVSIVR